MPMPSASDSALCIFFYLVIVHSASAYFMGYGMNAVGVGALDAWMQCVYLWNKFAVGHACSHVHKGQ